MLIGTRQWFHDAPALNIVLNGRGHLDLQQYYYLGLTIRCNKQGMLEAKQKIGLLFRPRQSSKLYVNDGIQHNGTTYPRSLYNSVGLCSLYVQT